MTALQWIIKEAKILRKKSPKMEWKKAVAQASAIYASKHKGKSPVGKKKAKKVVRKKAAKKVGTVKRKVARKKKPSEQSILNKIHIVKRNVDKLNEAQHKHMSGVDNDLIKQLNTYKGLIRYYTNNIEIYKEAIKKQKDRGLTPTMVSNLKRNIKKFQSLIKEYKTHIAQLKKHI